MRVGAAHAAVVAAQHLTAVALELLHEQIGRDTGEMPFHHIERQAGQLGDAGARRLAALLGARGERHEIVAECVALCVLERRAKRLAAGDPFGLELDGGV